MPVVEKFPIDIALPSTDGNTKFYDLYIDFSLFCLDMSMMLDYLTVTDVQEQD